LNGISNLFGLAQNAGGFNRSAERVGQAPIDPNLTTMTASQGIGRGLAKFLGTAGDSGRAADDLLGLSGDYSVSGNNRQTGLANNLNWFGQSMNGPGRGSSMFPSGTAANTDLEQAGNVFQFLAPLAIGGRTGAAISENFGDTLGGLGGYQGSRYSPYTWLNAVFQSLNDQYGGLGQGRFGAY
jgi:hypothetical protein